MGEDHIKIHILQNYAPGKDSVGGQMIGAKSIYIPGKALIKYNNGSITEIMMQSNVLDYTEKIIKQKTPEFYKGSQKIPKKLAKDILSAARKLDKNGKTLVARIKEAEKKKK